MKISFQDSSKYAGIVNLPVLSKVLNDYSIKYTATLVASSLQSNQTRRRENKDSVSRHHPCSARIAVCGIKSEIIAISDIFSKAGLYFQQPLASEFDRNLEYWNPHYLVRPNSKMPNLGNLTLSSDEGSTVASEKLNELNMNRFTQLFDSADDSGIQSQVVPSLRLRSTLKPLVYQQFRENMLIRYSHQLTALTMMCEKECGLLENTIFPSLWKQASNSRINKRSVIRI